MESFTGRITKDGKVIASDVSGSMFHTQHGALTGWHGTLDTNDAKAAHELFLSDGFELELSDGRSGRAWGNGHTPGTSVVEFTGTGPLK